MSTPSDAGKREKLAACFPAKSRRRGCTQEHKEVMASAPPAILHLIFSSSFTFIVFVCETIMIRAMKRLSVGQPVTSYAASGTSMRHIVTSSIRETNDQQGSWFSKISNSLMVRKIEPSKDSHSRLLTDSQAIYEMQIHNVRPGSMQEYLGNFANYVSLVQQKDPSYELVASWRVDVGDQDQVVNIWRYQQGYGKANETRQLLRTDASLKSLIRDQEKMLRSRENQFMMAFSFWGHPVPAVRDSCYEMRSYVLKPGTMIEWGNNW